MSDLTEFELYAVGRIKGLQKELAELRQAINRLPSRNSTALVSEIYDAIELAKRAAQAKEQDSE